MECIKEDHMVRFKEGKIKDSEKFVFCKLFSSGSTERPEIHGYTDASLTKTNFTIKVRSFASVKENDRVPQIVKARYDDYICLRGEGSSVMYLRTDSRKQRDEWCAVLNDVINRKSTGPHRRSTVTESNRPAPSRRGRKKTDPIITAPASVEGIFDQQMEVIAEGKSCVQEGEGSEGKLLCCPRKHMISFHRDGQNMVDHPGVIYENIHFIRDEKLWREEQLKQRTVLLQSGDLYNEFHNLKMVQEQGDDDLYVEPILGAQREPIESRWSGCSSTSEKSNHDIQGLRSDDGITAKIPVEQSWPNSPNNSPDQSPDIRLARSNPAFLQELAGTLHRHATQKEPEASLCLKSDRSEPVQEPVYENSVVRLPQDRSNGIRTPIKQTQPPLPPKPKNALDIRDIKNRKDSLKPVPTERSSEPKCPPSVLLKPVPARRVGGSAVVNQPTPPRRGTSLPMKEQGRKLKEEKMSPRGVKVELDKTILSRNMPTLCQKHDSILVTGTSPEIQREVRIGDQIIKVNAQMLNGADFAKTCIEMTDTPKVSLTLKRIPFGNVCTLTRTRDDLKEIGVELRGTEIVDCRSDGLLAIQGNLQSMEAMSFHTAGVRCNYVITEINMKPVSPHASTDEVKEMLREAGRDTVLILHPVDFKSLQTEPEGECLYEEMC